MPDQSEPAESESSESFDVAVVGGGPAGLTTALYTTRLGHETVLFDRGGGRAAMMQDTHNVIGVTEDVSGVEFLEIATEQVVSYGGEHRRTFVSDASRTDDGRFALETDDGTVLADRIVLATGFSDGRPDPPAPRTGRGLHYCLHCDAYMLAGSPVYVMGSGDSAAHVAMIMLNFTDEVDLLLDAEDPEWDEETGRMLDAHPVEVIESEVTGVDNDEDGWLEAMEFADGSRREYLGGFAMYGSQYNDELATALGCEVDDDGTVPVADDCQTSVPGVYAVGDLTPGHNQIPVAMGEGAKAGISIHYDLRKFPRSLEEIERRGPVEATEVPGMSPRLLETAVAHEGSAGGDAAHGDD